MYLTAVELLHVTTFLAQRGSSTIFPRPFLGDLRYL